MHEEAGVLQGTGLQNEKVQGWLVETPRPGQIRSELLDTGSLGLVHWHDPEGEYGEGGWREVQDEEHVYTRGGYMAKPIQYCKVKKKKKKKKEVSCIEPCLAGSSGKTGL